MAQKQEVKIRFNTNYRDDDPLTKEWRVIVNGQEYFCNHVMVNCPSYTSKDPIEGVGPKWHISCQAQKVEYVRDDRAVFPPNFFREIIIS